MKENRKPRWNELFQDGGPGSSSRKEDKAPGNGDGDESDSSDSYEDVGDFIAREIREILRLRDSDHSGIPVVGFGATHM